jgi:hypothetical protein
MQNTTDYYKNRETLAESGKTSIRDLESYLSRRLNRKLTKDEKETVREFKKDCLPN